MSALAMTAQALQGLQAEGFHAEGPFNPPVLDEFGGTGLRCGDRLLRTGSRFRLPRLGNPATRLDGLGKGTFESTVLGGLRLDKFNPSGRSRLAEDPAECRWHQRRKWPVSTVLHLWFVHR